MHNFKQYLRAVLFVALIIVLNCVLQYTTVPPYHTQNLFRDLKQQQDIDILFMGDSLCKSSFNASLISDTLQVKAFNIGQSGASLGIVNVLLEHTLKEHTVGTVVLSYGYDFIGTSQEVKEDSNYPQIIKNVEDISLKLKYFTKLLYTRYTYTLFYWSGMSHPTHIPEIVALKQTEDYKKGKVVIYRPDSQPTIYLGKGCFAYKQDTERSQSFTFNEADAPYRGMGTTITPETMTLLKELKKLCDDHGITLVCITPPQPQTVLNARHTELAAVSKTLTKELKTLGIPYYDQNQDALFADLHADYKFRDVGGHIYYPYIDEYSKKICTFLQQKKLY